MQQNRPRLFTIAFITLLLMMAWSDRFITDDAFVSFGYARNLAEGRGLVWNAGERVEGYPSLIWTLLMAAPIALGRDPVEFSFVAGIACLLGVLLTTWRLCGRCLLTRRQAMLVLLVLGTNYSFSAWSTGGQEIILQTLVATALVLEAARLIEGPWPPRETSLLFMSLLMGFALLVRLDTAVFVLATGVPVAAWVCRWSPRPLDRMRRLGWLAVPAALIIVAWAAWRLSFYGVIMPNFIRANLAARSPAAYGLFYVYIFFFSYLLVWLPVVLLPAVPRLIAGKPALWLSAIAPAAWLLYVILAGGDTMEFRIMLPAMPMLSILIVWVTFQHIQQTSVRNALLLLTFIGTIHHAITFDGSGGVERLSVESIPELAGRVDPGGVDWVNIGRRLGRDFERGAVVIATTAAGAIPYYSRLETIDMQGRCDRWIARNAQIEHNRVGFRRDTPLSYLLKRGANLVLGDPAVMRRDQLGAAGDVDSRKFRVDAPGGLPASACVVGIPLGADQYLECLYLVPNPAIARRIEAEHWPTRPARR